ncbi:hypothetical protein [Pseudoalteromonas prydzensis]|uniref:hypothetical protein n=1 Tax=Pseudoalteromonas prydzensis TaxID=182141 RepID=UPI003FD2DEE4
MKYILALCIVFYGVISWFDTFDKAMDESEFVAISYGFVTTWYVNFRHISDCQRENELSNNKNELNLVTTSDVSLLISRSIKVCPIQSNVTNLLKLWGSSIENIYIPIKLVVPMEFVKKFILSDDIESHSCADYISALYKICPTKLEIYFKT